MHVVVLQCISVQSVVYAMIIKSNCLHIATDGLLAALWHDVYWSEEPCLACVLNLSALVHLKVHLSLVNTASVLNFLSQCCLHHNYRLSDKCLAS